MMNPKIIPINLVYCVYSLNECYTLKTSLACMDNMSEDLAIGDKLEGPVLNQESFSLQESS